MVAVEEFGLIYFMITAIQMRQQIDGIFASLSTIYKSRKFNLIIYWTIGRFFLEIFRMANHTDENEVAFRYLARANSTSEWMWTINSKYIKYSLASLATTSLLSVLYCYSIEGDANVDHYYRPGKYLCATETKFLRKNEVENMKSLTMSISVCHGTNRLMRDISLKCFSAF